MYVYLIFYNNLSLVNNSVVFFLQNRPNAIVLLKRKLETTNDVCRTGNLHLSIVRDVEQLV